MINKFTKIKNYRIFRDYKWSATSNFGVYNLIFGLNGSGKSTLSYIFDDIKNKNCAQGEFSVCIDNVEYNSSNLNNTNENIYVFNENFIEQNLQEFSNLKGIVYLSDKNIGLKKVLDEKRETYNKLSKNKIDTDNQYNKIYKDFESSLSLGAKNIKEDFHILGGIGNELSNYNKTLFQHDIADFEDFIIDENKIKNIKEQIENCKKNLKDEIKPSIEKISFEIDNLLEVLTKVKNLIKQDIKIDASIKISNEIYNWIEEGIKLHNGSTKCLFCGNNINADRMKTLESIYDATTSDFKIFIQENLNKLNNYLNISIDIDLNCLYSDNYSLGKEIKCSLDKNLNVFKSDLSKLIELLNLKLKNPYLSISEDIDVKSVLTNYENVILDVVKLNEIIKKNNDKTEVFAKQQRDELTKLRKLLVAQNYNNLSIKKKHNDLNNKAKESLDLESKLDVLKHEILEIESELVDVIKAGSAFNKLLAQFLGRDEIELKYDETDKGYKIIRKENQTNAKNLSEGEKTAIAFIYFLIKVKENGNDIKNSIIIFDDPISSMDSNHIFNAYSFIVTYFKDAAQLFVLTHNFTFFKLMRRYFCKEKQSKNVYFIENIFITINNKKVRTALIQNLPKAILQASSEYPYLVKTMLDFEETFSNEQQIELNDYLNIANICRKVLESFCSFKVPQYTNDFKESLLQLYKCNKPENYFLTQEENMQAEKIYKFVNSFSHNNSYFNDEEINSLIGESKNIVNEILALIKKTDIDHYNGIIKQIKGL